MSKTDYYFVKKAEELIAQGESPDKAFERAYNDEMSLAPSEDTKKVVEKEKIVFGFLSLKIA
jgi:hypothetical protein